MILVSRFTRHQFSLLTTPLLSDDYIILFPQKPTIDGSLFKYSISSKGKGSSWHDASSKGKGKGKARSKSSKKLSKRGTVLFRPTAYPSQNALPLPVSQSPSVPLQNSSLSLRLSRFPSQSASPSSSPSGIPSIGSPGIPIISATPTLSLRPSPANTCPRLRWSDYALYWDDSIENPYRQIVVQDVNASAFSTFNSTFGCPDTASTDLGQRIWESCSMMTKPVKSSASTFFPFHHSKMHALKHRNGESGSLYLQVFIPPVQLYMLEISRLPQRLLVSRS
jgi:hypothetical protein